MCILVVGMHRSGTSAFTRVLNLLGCDLPKTLMQPHKSNETGHWESNVIQHFNDRVLSSAGTRWDDWLEVNPGWLQSPKADACREEALALLSEEFGASRLFVLKDPRIGRILPFWLSVLEEAGIRPLIVSPVRNPLEVAASLAGRNGFEAGLGHLLWLRHVLDAESASRGTTRYFTSYDRLIGGWARVATDAQAKLGIAWPRLSDKAAGEIESFLSDHHRHHHQPVEAVLDNPTLSAWLRDTFEIFSRWATAGESPQDFAALDLIGASLNSAAPAFSRLLSAEQGKSKRLEKELVATKEAEKEKASRLEAELVATKTAEKEKASRLEAELRSERQRLGEMQEQTSQLKGDLKARSLATDEAAKAMIELRHRLEQTESALAQRRHETEETAAELTAAREELRQAALARAEAETISAGLKEHVVLLMADLKERQAALETEREARAAELLETNRAVAALASQVKQVLAVLDSSRHELATRLGEAEQTHARQMEIHEARLRLQAEIIEALRRDVDETQSLARHEQTEADRLRLAAAEEIEALRRQVEDTRNLASAEQSEARRLRQVAAEEIGRAAGLFNGHGSHSRWRPFRLRRQIAFLRNSGLFDAEWYLREYTDVASTGMDPLRHYVEFGAKEGRWPNPALKRPNGQADAEPPEPPRPQMAEASEDPGDGR